MHEDYDIKDSRDRDILSIKLIAKMPTLAALAFRTAMGLPIVYPKKKYNYIENLLYMMLSNPEEEDFVIDQNIIKALDVLFILHGDHE